MPTARRRCKSTLLPSVAGPTGAELGEAPRRLAQGQEGFRVRPASPRCGGGVAVRSDAAARSRVVAVRDLSARRRPALPIGSVSGPRHRALRPARPRSQDTIGSEVLSIMFMQFSSVALWNLSSVPFEFVKGKAMENGTKAANVRERQLRLMEECLTAMFPSLVHTALLPGLANIT